ncbi:prophage ps3 protein 01 [Lachnospiraceae bacterium KM106-2]|nr:prophage ps3 protein 01 [Lachnospiraceae bacterium KM106-2]
MDNGLNSGNVITVEDISTILERYNIGKKPLAKVLGWGETTIIRYLEGDIPTIEYSERLKLILSSPIAYLNILNKNQDKITGIAYRKSKDAVMKKIMESKINVVAQYIINQRQGKITLMELQIMLHYIQGFALGFTGKPMFEDVYYINPEFLPFERITEQYKLSDFKFMKFDHSLIPQKELEYIDCIIDSFDWYGIYSLKCFIADERFQYDICKDENGKQYITNATLEKCFKEIIGEYFMQSYREIYKYADAKFNEVRKLS